jgi:hypothetical protein
VTTVKFPKPEEMPAHETGSYRWLWTAHFEAFNSDVDDLGERPGSTPLGTYRFVVDGLHRKGRRAREYSLASEPFEVRRWDGITIPTAALDESNRLTFEVGPRTEVSAGGVSDVLGPIDYPDTYESPAPFIRRERTVVRDPSAPNDPDLFEWYCLECSFRPWADFAEPACAEGTIVRADGTVLSRRASGSGGSYTVPVALEPGDVALVRPGAVRDDFDEANGESSSLVMRGEPSAAALATAADLAAQRTGCG